jgi:hypothetical protein
VGVWFRQLLLINGNGGKQGSLKIINTCLLVCVWASVCDFYDCGDMYHRQLSSPNPFGRKQTNLLKERLGPVLSPSNQNYIHLFIYFTKLSQEKRNYTYLVNTLVY